MQYQIYDSFYSGAKKLRGVFDERFHDPLEPRADRFIWDYWHVPHEYTHLRTQAHVFFPPKLYQNFHRHLVEWGRENLGCHDVSPPWLSCYVDGCRQERHSDVPHGPLAFVYSLTPWERRKFRGGETFLEREGVIPPKFNRLLVFNPAIPHGVRKVSGTHDLREGRLVIHGWFVNPRPFWYGPLKSPEISRGIERGLAPVLAGALNLGRGFLSARLTIAPAGNVRNIKVLVSTLTGANPRHVKKLLAALSELQFPTKRAGTRLTLPLLIE